MYIKNFITVLYITTLLKLYTDFRFAKVSQLKQITIYKLLISPSFYPSIV